MGKANFNEFRFKGFEYNENATNKYINIKSRINDDKTKIIVRYSLNQVFETPYGYGLRLDHNKGVWLKNWQVSKVWDEEFNEYQAEIVLDKNFTALAEFKESDDIHGDYDFSNIWESLMSLAEEQDGMVRWKK